MKRATSWSVASSTLVPPIGSITGASGCDEECCQTAILKSTLGLVLADEHLLDRAANRFGCYAVARIDRDGNRRGPPRHFAKMANTLSVSYRLHKTYNPVDVAAVRVSDAAREVGSSRKVGMKAVNFCSGTGLDFATNRTQSLFRPGLGDWAPVHLSRLRCPTAPERGEYINESGEV